MTMRAVKWESEYGLFTMWGSPHFGLRWKREKRPGLRVTIATDRDVILTHNWILSVPHWSPSVTNIDDFINANTATSLMHTSRRQGENPNLGVRMPDSYSFPTHLICLHSSTPIRKMQIIVCALRLKDFQNMRIEIEIMEIWCPQIDYFLVHWKTIKKWNKRGI